MVTMYSSVFIFAYVGCWSLLFIWMCHHVLLYCRDIFTVPQWKRISTSEQPVGGGGTLVCRPQVLPLENKNAQRRYTQEHHYTQELQHENEFEPIDATPIEIFIQDNDADTVCTEQNNMKNELKMFLQQQLNPM